ncbi:MAG: coenzyme F390 synthetase, partial [Methanoregulaceae archaeon]|nr:coenzyme F390 synthetase [Methanoregulaceae archaeon]
MVTRAFYQEAVERLPREELNALIDERVQYTIGYASDHSPFYRSWFSAHGIDPATIRSHEDLLELPIISGKTIRENQPPFTDEFMFRSVDW